MSKKTVLKKYTGKGGSKMDNLRGLASGVYNTVNEIPGTLKGMGENLRKAVNPGDLGGAIGRGASILIGKGKDKIKKIIKDRIQVQKNWENRKDNSNYYGSSKDFR